jgi:hypothetical protein
MKGNKEKCQNHITDPVGDIPKDNHTDHFVMTNGIWYAGTDGDAPTDVYSGRDYDKDITRHVLYKSPKGHTILFDDTDAKEQLTIIDRMGQVINMICPA